jgi:hypothetical protein
MMQGSLIRAVASTEEEPPTLYRSRRARIARIPTLSTLHGFAHESVLELHGVGDPIERCAAANRARVA